jgi:hypothetical protein
MTTISTTSPRKLVMLTLVLGLVAATLAVTIVLVMSGASGSGPSDHSSPAVAPERQFMGGPGEGAPGMRGRSASTTPAAAANDGTQHPGRRP